ncbi:methionine--tRNA ligase [Desulfolutivibrio sulfoxidireducens]|uniref:methionine--tRNA ligase n=1 Tax=Desulfolutivibrio sulfoxidireducens TaxID=2773299 RepID=UPI00159EAE97|nr:methionine--tRNA ligase [Desulfolutivibrio sulfoxidireducens]QLA15367.1 methionine--tRNA ligase [Desulfolutivibrio sulfoxidireducens]QLA18946.1 methionine--tRNA ligase [Desulfolutivibrio sulfoxidireducens]
MNRFFISTPIYYVNAKPHLGHAYTTIVADCAARFHRLFGEEVFFLTGTDEHGDKIAEAAKAAGQTPAQYADAISALFRDMWPHLGIEYTRFIRTTEKEHVRTVQAALQKVHDQGDIYFGDYGGHYCFGCERFLTEKELVDGLCPDHKTKPEYIAEKNYFFRMSRYQDRLLEHIRKNPDFIRPTQYRNEVISLLESGALEDLCISRPTSRLTWGVKLPFDENYVTYVWFDALINYITALGWPNGENFAAFWPCAQHLVAKDILKPHAVFWPTMLMALGLEPYRHLNVHGYWLVKDTKMSKSLGNVVEPRAMAQAFGVSGMRYFLLREMTFGHDASFSEESMTARFNADLANDLGNLFNRVLAMTHRYFGGVLPETAGADFSKEDSDLAGLAVAAACNWRDMFVSMRFSKGLEALWELVRALNKHVDASAPWTLFKEGKTARLSAVLHTTLAGMRKVAMLLWPVMPEAAEKMLAQLGQAFAPATADAAREMAELVMLPGGTRVETASALFPRRESLASPETATAPAKASKAKEKSLPAGAPAPAKDARAKDAPAPAEVEFADFQKLDLRLGTVLSVAPVPGADRLYIVTVDLGEDSPRQVVAGLAEFFKPDELSGRQVVVVANLKPRKLRGVMSHGMILAVRTSGGMELLTASGAVVPGSRVS